MRWVIVAMIWSLACALGCSTTSAHLERGNAQQATPRGIYRVAYNVEQRALQVEACFRNWKADHLRAADRGAVAHLIEPGLQSKAKPRVPLRVGPNGSCARYVVSVDSMLGRAPAGRAGRSAFTVPSTAWLWRPEPYPQDGRVHLSFELPPGQRVSASWPRSSHGGHYVLERRDFFLLSHTALGTFSTMQVEAASQVADVAVLYEAKHDHRSLLRQWLAAAMEASARLCQRASFRRAQIVLVPARGAAQSVAFGLVGRGGQGSALLMPNRAASPDEMVGEWVAVHELAHLHMPHVERQDAWLSEGLATYYQEVLRARAGLQSEATAWHHLRKGFERGRRSLTGRSLRSDSAKMHERGAYLRVYWAGAVFALQADVALRRDHQVTLDALVCQARNGNARKGYAWSALPLLAEMDQRFNEPVLVPMARRYLQQASFPRTAELLAKLGVKADGKRVVLDDSAPWASVRRAIFNGKSASDASRSPPAQSQ